MSLHEIIKIENHKTSGILIFLRGEKKTLKLLNVFFIFFLFNMSLKLDVSRSKAPLSECWEFYLKMTDWYSMPESGVFPHISKPGAATGEFSELSLVCGQ